MAYAPDQATFRTKGPLKFFQKYPLTTIGADASFAAIYKGTTTKIVDVAADGRDPANGVVQRTIRMQPPSDQARIVEKDHRIAYCEISLDTGGIAAMSNVQADRSRQPVKLQIFADNPTGNRVPVFYLPYQDDSNHRITLHDRSGTANPTFFVTDIVNGCSVYVEGSATKPTVYHLNAKNTLPKKKASDFTPVSLMPKYSENRKLFEKGWDLKWETMDARVRDDAPPPSSVAALASRTTYKVEAPDYQVWPGPPTHAFLASLAQLQAQGRIPRLVGTDTVDELDLQTSEGTVFGVREGLNWRFFVQKKVLVSLIHHDAKNKLSNTERIGKFFSGKTPLMNRVVGVQWAIRTVDEFYPTQSSGRMITL
jgi:hypothetical protein